MEKMLQKSSATTVFPGESFWIKGRQDGRSCEEVQECGGCSILMESSEVADGGGVFASWYVRWLQRGADLAESEGQSAGT